MKKILSLLLVLGCVVLFSQIASAATVTYGPYTASVDVSGSFEFTPELKLTSDYTTSAGTITWANSTGAFASADNWKTANVAIKITVTNQKAGATVKLYQDNNNVSNGVYQSTMPYTLAAGSTTHAGLVRANSYGGTARFTMGHIVSTQTLVTVNPDLANYVGGFYMKDKQDKGSAGTSTFVADAPYYTILTDQGYLTYMNGTAGGFQPFTGGILYIHFGANFRDATAGVYGTKSITLESYTE